MDKVRRMTRSGAAVEVGVSTVSYGCLWWYGEAGGEAGEGGKEELEGAAVEIRVSIARCGSFF